MNTQPSELNDYQLNIVEFYCNNDLKELRKICDPFLREKNIPYMNHDDIYEIAMECLCDSVKTYSEEKSQFKTYLTGNIKRKLYTYMRDSTRSCRCNVERDRSGRIITDEYGNNKVIYDTSIYSETEDGGVLGDYIPMDYNLEDSLLKEEDDFSDNLKIYLNDLSLTQKKIAYYLIDGYKANEIKLLLGLNDQQYNSCVHDMKNYDRRRILFRNLNNNTNECAEKKENIEMGTSEKTKNTSYSLASISKKLRNYQIRDNHVLQRASGQWNGKTKSELISDILQGKALTPIIISEEIKNGVQMLWLIDGKQRCTNIDDFLNDGFGISKTVKVQEIAYQTHKVDEDGNKMFNEDGFPIPEVKMFNIVGKKFSQLPEELQDKFKDYQLPVMLNLNCDKRDIAYDISRFNRCRPMNKAQNGWTGFDEDFAELVDNILKMDFFKPDCTKSNYTNSNITSGALRRMIVETVMVSEFMDSYHKDFVKMCEFLTENANENLFIDIYEDIDVLTEVLTEDTASLFNSKNTFLWFSLYKRFKKLDIDVIEFGNFLCEFKNSLHNTHVDGVSFDELDEKRGTKDKYAIKEKLDLLEKIMFSYFDIEETEVSDQTTEGCDLYTFLKQNVGEEINEDDVLFYEDSLTDYTVEIPNDSKILDPENHKSMVAICAYSYYVDEDLSEWLVDYVARNNDYVRNQNENYLYMKKDFDKFINKNDCGAA